MADLGPRVISGVHLTLSTDHSYLTVVIPEGVGRDNTLVATVYGQESNGLSFSFNPPVIDTVMDLAGNPLKFGTCCRCVTDAQCLFRAHTNTHTPYLYPPRRHSVTMACGMNLCCAAMLCNTLCEGSTGGGYKIRINGTSFGMKSTRVVYFATHSWRNETYGGTGSVVNGGNTNILFPRGWRQCLEDIGGSTPHNEIRCTVPSGVGANLSVGTSVWCRPGW